MFTKLVFFAILASPIYAAVAKDIVNSCSPTEFACGDGGCVSAELVCDGSTDCADGLDESACGTAPLTLPAKQPLQRHRRQATCRKDQWRCRDGSCISFDGKCDGIVDCPDSSDETHALCRKSKCQHNWFRCTYGACVDGTAACNGEQECADNSDELLPRCRNETDEIRGQFKCLDGTSIPAASHCDGEQNCPDGSDETVRTCAAKTCPSYLFQCAYGACVDSDANCNQVKDCADGSDEAPELCDKSGTAPITPIKPATGKCVLPPYPNHGTYSSSIPNGKPGEGYDHVAINVTCLSGYGLDGSRSISCHDGWWAEQMPNCVALCHLVPHASVEYMCTVSKDGVTGRWPCREYEPSGTLVIPTCQGPNYYSPTPLNYMHCIEGTWDYVATCLPGLTKNGTNITIIVKDSVEVHISDIQYVVPINNSYTRPVVPITDIDYIINRRDNIPTYNRSSTKKPTSGTFNYNSSIYQFSGIVDAVTSKPYDNTINIDTDKNNHNEDTDSNSDEINSAIDYIDWRMGVPDNRSTNIPLTLTPKLSSRTKNSYGSDNVDQNNYARNVHHSIRSTENNDDDEYSIDARFGNSESGENRYGSKLVSTTSRSSTVGSKTTNSSPIQNAGVKLYTSKSNNTNIYFNITNSKVNVHTDGEVVLKN